VIVTVTLDPALEVSYETEHLRPGEAHPVRRVRYAARGRGVAVARILTTFGHDVTVAGLAGGSSGEVIRSQLARDGVPTQFTRTTAETRRVVAVLDRSCGATTTFAEPAPYITTEELGRLATDYRKLLTAATAVVLCGDLPESLPAEIYGSFVSYAAEAGVPVIVNAAGDALAYGAARQPTLVVPEPADTERPWSGTVAMPLNSGVRVLTPDGGWEARRGSPGAVDAAYLDALVAGFVPGLALAWSWPDTLLHALAITAAWNPVAGLDEQAYERALASVVVERLPSGHN
jgi:tagatose 6-phosphate kinase